MNILMVGRDVNLMEGKLKFGDSHDYLFAKDHATAAALAAKADVIFDFLAGESPDGLIAYKGYTTAIVFADASKTSLLDMASMSGVAVDFTLFGFCGLPTFLNRPVLEVSLFKNQYRDELEKICARLKTTHAVVDDRVGMVTPRVVCMIINEAYYTVQEGTASREDIDLAMKLGTNYPMGPFEWAGHIGVNHVFELLQAVYEDTRDERYKICPLLKKERLALS